MATFFLDFENGNDANDGTTFANRWKTMTSGATAARIAPNDTVRMMGSPDPTSLGNAAWLRTIANNFLPTTVNISAVSNATPIQITTSAVHGLTTGNVVMITGQTGNRYINGLWKVTVVDTTKFTLDGSLAAGAGGTATGTIRNYSSRVLCLATQCNKTIDQCEVAWTASANATSTLSTTRKQGDGAASLAIAAGFTTGLVAYRALPATLDLSAYQQVTIWIQVNAALAASTLSLRLCSDAAGVTTVDTLAIPAIVGLSRYIPITIDKGSALGASIASVALYADLDPGTVTVILDNIVTVKSVASADSLGLQSLIGKNVSGETFHPIASIEETVVAFDSGPSWNNSAGNAVHSGYWGTEETVTTYKLEPIKLTDVNSGAMGLTLNDDGTAGNPITFSGGWDRTNMSSQAGMTWLDGRNGLGTGVVYTNRAYNTITNMGVVRFNIGFQGFGMTNLTLSNIHANGNMGGGSVSGIQIGGAAGHTLSDIYACNNYVAGIQLGQSNLTLRRVLFGDCFKKINCNGWGAQSAGIAGVGIWTQASNLTIGIISELCGNYLAGLWLGSGGGSGISIDKISNVSNNRFSAIAFGGAQNVVIHEVASANGHGHAVLGFYASGCGTCRINKLTSSGNAAMIYGDTSNTPTLSGDVQVRRWTSSDTTDTTTWDTGYGEQRVTVGDFGDVPGESRVYVPGGRMRSETTFRHTASGVSRRLAPVNSTERTSDWPVRDVIASLAVNASALVTVAAWFRRTNTALTGMLVCKKNQLTGVTTDQTATMTASGDQTPTSITRSGSTATVTKTAHGYLTGNIVQITGAVQTEYNVVATITVTDADHFTYAVAGTPATPATGTLVMGQWEKLTITFTPTEAGVVEIEAQAYGGSTNFLYVDDVEKSQA